MVENENIKQAALSMIEQGLVSIAEAAWLAGRSRQIVHFWVKGTPHAKALRGLPEVRVKRLKAEWKQALKTAEKS